MVLRAIRSLLLMAGDPPERVSLSDVEGKLRELSGEAQTAASEIARPALGGAIALGVVAVAAVYLLGRRRGRRQASVLEIHRV